MVLRQIGVAARASWLVRLVAAVLAGLCLAFLAEQTLHAFAPTTTERGVVTASSVERSEGRRSSSDYSIQARMDSGLALDLADANAAGLVRATERGRQVIVTRSTLDGQVLAVRTPTEVVDTSNYAAAWVLRALAVLIGGAAAVLALRPVEPWSVTALVAVAVAFGAYLWVPPVLDRTYDPPNGWRIFDDTRFFPERVVALGSPAAVSDGTVTVTGPPVAGLPAGADPELAGFETLTVPLRSESTKGRWVPMWLVGDGAGNAELLRETDGPCGGAPGAFPKDVPEGTAEGPLCAVVPPGFVPRYLIVGAPGPDDVAITLG